MAKLNDNRDEVLKKFPSSFFPMRRGHLFYLLVYVTRQSAKLAFVKKKTQIVEKCLHFCINEKSLTLPHLSNSLQI